jgi:hypothetical protein
MIFGTITRTLGPDQVSCLARPPLPSGVDRFCCPLDSFGTVDGVPVVDGHDADSNFGNENAVDPFSTMNHVNARSHVAGHVSV